MNNTHKLIGISGVNKYNAITGVDNSLEKFHSRCELVKEESVDLLLDQYRLSN